MSQIDKVTKREKVTVRLEPSLVKSARKIAKRDYAEERYISAVVEDALKRYIANENQSDDFSAVLSQTEFALYDRISRKIERELFETLKVATSRMGNLIATAGYDIALTSVILETNMKKDRTSKELYEKCRAIATQRMKRRYDKEGADEIASLIEENENLKEELATARVLAKKKEKKTNDSSATEVIQNLSESLRSSEDLQLRYANYYHSLTNFLKQNDATNLLGKRKSIEQLLQEFEAKHPKPRGL